MLRKEELLFARQTAALSLSLSLDSWMERASLAGKEFRG
jgi:hypothetical protein